jgi:hypothetical protein
MQYVPDTIFFFHFLSHISFQLKAVPHLHQASNSRTNECLAAFSVTSSSASDASAITTAGLSGPSTAADSEDPGGIDNDVDEPDIDADKIAWLDLAEHDELAECLDTCVDRWQN